MNASIPLALNSCVHNRVSASLIPSAFAIIRDESMIMSLQNIRFEYYFHSIFDSIILGKDNGNGYFRFYLIINLWELNVLNETRTRSAIIQH